MRKHYPENRRQTHDKAQPDPISRKLPDRTAPRTKGLPRNKMGR